MPTGKRVVIVRLLALTRVPRQYRGGLLSGKTRRKLGSRDVIIMQIRPAQQMSETTPFPPRARSFLRLADKRDFFQFSAIFVVVNFCEFERCENFSHRCWWVELNEGIFENEIIRFPDTPAISEGFFFSPSHQIDRRRRRFIVHFGRILITSRREEISLSPGKKSSNSIEVFRVGFR